MNLEKLEAAAKALKEFIREQKSYNRLRDKAGTVSGSPKQMQKASTDMHYSAMHLRRLHKAAWKAILDADLETTLDDEIARPHGFHKYTI